MNLKTHFNSNTCLEKSFTLQYARIWWKDKIKKFEYITFRFSVSVILWRIIDQKILRATFHGKSTSNRESCKILKNKKYIITQF